MAAVRDTRQTDDPSKMFLLRVTPDGPRFVLENSDSIRSPEMPLAPPKSAEAAVPALPSGLAIRPPVKRSPRRMRNATVLRATVTTADRQMDFAVPLMTPASHGAQQPDERDGMLLERPILPPSFTLPAVVPASSASPLPGETASTSSSSVPSPASFAPAPSTRQDPLVPRRPTCLYAPTETHTVLDEAGSERLPTAFWKAALPPSAVPADYTLGSGVERVHAPVASADQVVEILQEAQEAAFRAAPREPALVRFVNRAREVQVPFSLVGAVLAVILGLGLMLSFWPVNPQDDIVVRRSVRQAEARLAGSKLFARGLNGEMQQALDGGRYIVVGRNEDGTFSNQNIVEDLVSNDLETAQKLGRIKSEGLGQPLFIIAKRSGSVSIVDRVNPGDRAAWRDYMMSVWYLKQHALSWPRERYASRESLDPNRTIAVMSDFVRAHPDSRVVAHALDDMRFVCYYALQDPAKFRNVALHLLDETLGQKPHTGTTIPELVYALKPHLKESMNQQLYMRIHRLTREQSVLHPTSEVDSGSTSHM